MTDAEWAALRERDYEQETVELRVNQDELHDLAAGYCPRTVQVFARMALETDEQRLRRNAEKPVKVSKTKGAVSR